MQNCVLAILYWTLRILRLGVERVGGVFVLLLGRADLSLPVNSGGWKGGRESVDFDFGRWESASRSVLAQLGFSWWEPAPSRVRSWDGTARAACPPDLLRSSRRFDA